MEKGKVKELMIPSNMSIKGAMKKLNETAEKILFVADDNGVLLGTVSDGDVRRGIINGLDFGEEVQGIMNRNFIYIQSDAVNIEKSARELMHINEVMQIPVLDQSGKIEDIILWLDLIDEKKTIRPVKLYPNQVVVMAGGQGVRLDPFTKILPKPLIPIGQKAIIEHIMERFYKSGFHNFLYTLNYKKEYIKLYLNENVYPYRIDWVEESDYLGTAGGLSLLKEKITDTFFVTNCDSLLDINFENVLDWHKEHEALITIIGCYNEFKVPFGVLECANSRLDRMLEKPIHDMIINTGVYVMEPQVIDRIPENRSLNMNELIDRASREEKISVYAISHGWLDVGQWDEYRKALKYLEQDYDEFR